MARKTYIFKITEKGGKVRTNRSDINDKGIQDVFDGFLSKNPLSKIGEVMQVPNSDDGRERMNELSVSLSNINDPTIKPVSVDTKTSIK